MRILHVVPTYYPAVRYGGPIYSVHGLCCALAKRGHHVDVFTTNVDGAGVSAVSTGQATRLGGVNVFYFETALGRRLYRAPKLAERLRKSIGEYDVVHLHSVFLWPTWVAARIAARHEVPYVVSPRGMLVRELIEARSTLIKRLWISLIEARSLREASAVHVTSELERVGLKQLKLITQQFVMIPNGIDLDLVASRPLHRVAPLQALGQRPIIANIGRINWKKGLDVLIKALAKIPNVDLVIAGNDEEDYTVKLEQIAEQVGVRDRVHFAGPLYDEDKWALLRKASIFCLPSRSENFANAVLEAMSVATPVVISRGVGLAPDVEEVQAGQVVEFGDTDELAGSLMFLLANAEVRRQMGLAGQKLAADRFSWSSIAERMEALYNTIVPDGAAPGFNERGAA